MALVLHRGTYYKWNHHEKPQILQCIYCISATFRSTFGFSPNPKLKQNHCHKKTTSKWTSFFAKILFPIDNKVCFIYQIRLLHPKRYWVLTKFQSEDVNYTDSWPRAPGNHNNLSFPLEFLQQFSRFLNAWYSCFIIKMGIFWNQI